MSTGSGIAIAGIWIAAAVATVFAPEAAGAAFGAAFLATIFVA